MAISRTHDIHQAYHHVEDIKELSTALSKAAAAAFPNQRGQRYAKVYALLLHWEGDELGVLKELFSLQKVLKSEYGFDVDLEEIPIARSHNVLTSILSDYLRKRDAKKNLIIVYYGGHAYMDEQKRCIMSHLGRGSSEVQWDALQVNLEQAESDVLLLLDCCAAGSAISTCRGSATKELLVACGFETRTPGVGNRSFTHNLVEELKVLKDRGPFTVAVLHAAITRRIIEQSSQRTTNRREPETKSPHHYILTNDRYRRSIELFPLVRTPESPAKPVVTPNILDEDVDMMTGLECNETALQEFSPDPEFKYPKVVLTVALQEKQWLEEDSWTAWLESIPGLVRYATVEAVFDSFSSLVIISVPMPVWTLIQDHPAVQFVTFAESNNKLISSDNQYNLMQLKDSMRAMPLASTSIEPLVGDGSSHGDQANEEA